MRSLPTPLAWVRCNSTQRITSIVFRLRLRHDVPVWCSRITLSCGRLVLDGMGAWISRGDGRLVAVVWFAYSGSKADTKTMMPQQ
eukprot:CCRYP_020318-RA/>CCRYP_020318-RA protein AED:0.00 eAED:0.00 QI:0/1/0.5/1/0/0/2/545/84